MGYPFFDGRNNVVAFAKHFVGDGEQCLLEKIDALVGAWLPGTEGQGITDDLKGQLQMTWFRRVEQLDQPVVGISSI
ncbi:hypothetical protein VNO80_05442 [Phaseolus coccineus]|uniref:Beta-glucosidase n=1 Tax=Phaseolus coccineus TaxID=3886 RepID=A0AAN9NK06_PHACN